jgi:acetyl esterase/lipase
VADQVDRARTHIVVLPGGGYLKHSPHEGEPVAAWLAGLGYRTSVFAYPLATRHPGPLRAVRDEVARVRRGGADRVALLGFSAGGHAAAMAALAPGGGGEEHVDFAILAYPVVTMQHAKVSKSRATLVGLDASDALRAETSADLLVTDGAPPFFIWHTAADEVIPVEHSYRMASALARAGVPHELHVFPEGRHGLGLADGEAGAETWTELCADWLERSGL